MRESRREDGLYDSYIDFLQLRVCSSLSFTLTSIAIPSRPFFLFRSTSYDVTDPQNISALHRIYTPMFLSQDAWDKCVIRSDTDSSVFAAPRTALFKR